MSGLSSNQLESGVPILRLFRFRPAIPEFDGILRQVMLPDLATRPGLSWVLVGRQGPDASGERLVASLWKTHTAMVDAVGAELDHPIFHPEYASATVDKRLDIAPIAIGHGDPGVSEPHIARLVIGRTKPGCLSEYLGRASAGAVADMAAGHGPQSVHIAVTGADTFATLSSWGEWSTVAKATGGSLDDPDMTRHTELLDHWHAEHYEVVSLRRPPETTAVAEPTAPPSGASPSGASEARGGAIAPESAQA